MAKMKVAQINKAGGDFEIVERDIPQPGPRQVRIKVEACGICHSDVLVKDGLWPGIQYPRIPGHEVAGKIDAVGSAITAWKVGQRVGVGWHGSHDFECEACRRGDFAVCANQTVTGVTRDGGYGEYMLAETEAVAAMPDDLSSDEAAPLLCAGITVFNALRNAGARSGDLVAVQGIGGLGHLGVQYARQMGFETVAIGRGKDKEPLARKFGAHHYIDAAAGDPSEQLKNLGAAKIILATAPDSKSMAALMGGVKPNGKLIVIGAGAEPLEVNGVDLLVWRKAVQGWPSGTAMDSEDTLRFSSLTGVRPMIEKFPLAQVKEAYERMHSGKARFRAVLTMGS
ncbi:MAG TPA: alcohol dehydrogenase [Terriglobales bacterium]|nr:alcohol dehydrogenase [Terriglobales bacterium]